jgi:hypothetical protein
MRLEIATDMLAERAGSVGRRGATRASALLDATSTCRDTAAERLLLELFVGRLIAGG